MPTLRPLIDAVFFRIMLAENVSKAIGALDASLSEGMLDRLVESTITCDRFWLADPSRVLRRLRDAHDALADRLLVS